jgi:hypothetical protein
MYEISSRAGQTMNRQLFAIVALLTMITTSHAQIVSTAVMSPNCDEAQLKEIAGTALTDIHENQSWDNEVKGYIITLDTSKMTYNDLIKKMQEKNCFK